MGVNVIVTDDLAVYKVVAKKLNLEHQICQFHVRRWVGRTLKELENTLSKEWLWVVEEIKELLEALPPDGDKRLYALWKQDKVSKGRRNDQQTPDYQLHDLLIRLSENWSSFCAVYTDPAIPWTNNGTEQVIGRMKMRARTVRGYKTWPGMQTGLMLADTTAN
ncbi:MAG: transposase [Pseudomonadota bacterium]